MINNIKKVISAVFKKKTYTDYESVESVFNEIILESTEKPNNSIILKCANLLEEALKISKQRIILLNRREQTDSAISDLDFLSNLTDQEFEHFKITINRYINIVAEKNVLMYQIEGFDSILGHLIGLEKEAKESLSRLKDAEKERTMFNRDIAYLEMEKTDLKEEHILLEQGLVLIKFFTIGLVAISAFAALVLGFLTIFDNINIFYPTVFISFILIFFIALLTILKSKIKKDLKLNVKKQNKAVSLLNKKNTVYVHHTNFANYICKKYRVKNSKHMEICLGELDSYKKLMDRVRVTKRVLIETEDELELFFRKKNVKMNKMTLYDFVQSIDLDVKKDKLDRLILDKKQFEETLNKFYDMQNEIWVEIENIKKENTNEIEVIEEMIKIFYREVDRFNSDIDKRQSPI